MAGDDRREQGAVIIQAVDSGRQIVAEVFAGMVLDEAKVSALLNARSRIIEQWGKAQHAGLVIGQTLLHLSRTLSEEEFRQVRRGSDRLFPFSDSLATKFRRAAALAEEWRIPPDRLPPYTAPGLSHMALALGLRRCSIGAIAGGSAYNPALRPSYGSVRRLLCRGFGPTTGQCSPRPA